jgi:hypothetical protein
MIYHRIGISCAFVQFWFGDRLRIGSLLLQLVSTLKSAVVMEEVYNDNYVPVEPFAYRDPAVD